MDIETARTKFFEFFDAAVDEIGAFFEDVFDAIEEALEDE